MTAAEVPDPGRNSRVYRLVSASSQRPWILKLYFVHPQDKRDRLRTEYQAFSFLWKNGVRSVPEPILSDPQKHFAIYECIEGRKLARESINESHVDQAAEFLLALNSLRNAPGAADLPPASEACFSVQAAEQSVQRRLDRFLPLLAEPGTSPLLKAFLEGEFIPATRKIFGELQYDSDLSRDAQTLSPSDFGFHNMLCAASGKLRFLDFEYFGWDDPAKMLSDFLLHPSMRLEDALYRRFASRVSHRFREDPAFIQRMRQVYPIYGLKWCMILLNEFLPDHLSRRHFANAALATDYAGRLNEQLLKAKRMLYMTLEHYERFPYLA